MHRVSVTDTNTGVTVIYQLVSVKEIPLYGGRLNCHAISKRSLDVRCQKYAVEGRSRWFRARYGETERV